MHSLILCSLMWVCASFPTNLKVRLDFNPARCIGDVDNVAKRVLPPLLPSQGIEAALLLFAVQYSCLVGSGRGKQVDRVSSNNVHSCCFDSKSRAWKRPGRRPPRRLGLHDPGCRAEPGGGRELKRTRPPPSCKEAYANGIHSIDRRGQ
jgi:hypothetical protein